MAARKKRRRKLHQKVGVSQVALSRKIAIVTREDPSFTPRQAAGKAAGILEHRKRKKR